MSDDVYNYQHPIETLASSWSDSSAQDMSTSVYKSRHPITEMGDVAREYHNIQADNKAEVGRANSRLMDTWAEASKNDMSHTAYAAQTAQANRIDEGATPDELKGGLFTACMKRNQLTDCLKYIQADSPPVLSVNEAAQFATDSQWAQLWNGYYNQTVATLIAKHPTMSASQADQIANNLARINAAKGGGAFLRGLSEKLGVAGAVADSVLTFESCQKGTGPCVLKALAHGGADLSALAVGGAVVTGCVEFGVAGPWGCAAGGIAVGLGVAFGLQTAGDAAIDIKWPDPKSQPTGQ